MENTLIIRCRRLWIKLKFIVTHPLERLRKLQRKLNARKARGSISLLLIFIICFIIAVLYYWNYFMGENISTKSSSILASANLPEKIITATIPPIAISKANKGKNISVFKKIKTVFKVYPRKDNIDLDIEIDDRNITNTTQRKSDHLATFIHTPGCKIPQAIVNYEKYINETNDTYKNASCGKRAIFLRKLDGNTVVASIRHRVIIKHYMKYKENYYDCCYQFLLKAVPSPSTDDTSGHQNLIYSNCTIFESHSKITLETDFINIKCIEYTDTNVTYTIYSDVYAFVKKIKETAKSIFECNKKFNVLMIGMSSMSLPRAGQALPRTVTIFQNEYWNGYRGYHKVADESFPNLMAVFTGKNITSFDEECAGNMDNCNRFMIWSRFKEAGYVTAYGEDYLACPDTFSNNYQFWKQPTDHYMRPFFLKSEYQNNNSTFLCAGKMCSGEHILHYALDFANTYKKDSFFGLFWINSFSHDAKSRPHEADEMLKRFFNQLKTLDILKNTFVIFFSDHGVRFGGQRSKMEGYYDDRMPMFFIWLPVLFKMEHTYQVSSILINQFRLVTPYDIYSTLLSIRQLSLCSYSTDDPPEGCPKCHSTFKKIKRTRTCRDVSISDRWCTCHKMYPLPMHDPDGRKAVDMVVKNITSMVKTIETQKCWQCLSLRLKTIYRIHFYYSKDNINMFYVVAFSMEPNNTIYEATVYYNMTKENYETQATILDPISHISTYKELGNCVLNVPDQRFCICQKIKNC